MFPHISRNQCLNQVYLRNSECHCGRVRQSIRIAACMEASRIVRNIKAKKENSHSLRRLSVIHLGGYVGTARKGSLFNTLWPCPLSLQICSNINSTMSYSHRHRTSPSAATNPIPAPLTDNEIQHLCREFELLTQDAGMSSPHFIFSGKGVEWMGKSSQEDVFTATVDMAGKTLRYFFCLDSWRESRSSRRRE